jgi:TPR repeat protein
MKTLSFLITGLLLACAFTNLQDVRADQADEDYKTGLKYYEGDDDTKDFAETFKWFKKAADQGNAKAKYNIGITSVPPV